MLEMTGANDKSGPSSPSTNDAPPPTKTKVQETLPSDRHKTQTEAEFLAEYKAQYAKRGIIWTQEIE